MSAFMTNYTRSVRETHNFPWQHPKLIKRCNDCHAWESLERMRYTAKIAISVQYIIQNVHPYLLSSPIYIRVSIDPKWRWTSTGVQAPRYWTTDVHCSPNPPIDSGAASPLALFANVPWSVCSCLVRCFIGRLQSAIWTTWKKVLEAWCAVYDPNR